VSTPAALPSPPGEGDIHEHIAARLAQHGWCVVEEYLNVFATAPLRDEALTYWQTGCFRLASIGKDRRAQPETRSDQILWLEPPYTEAQSVYLAHMESLRQVINRQLYLGLVDFECHYTRYAPGAYYKKHLDCFRDDSRRAVSCILYLNDAWGTDDGGALRLHHSTTNGSQFLDIPPRSGTLVCFLSADIWHEVLPTRRVRLSLTGWFRTR
jgi:SM-20-related protein